VADLLDDLNPPQRDAVLHTEGPLLVLAGAGSGKTRVLTYRIAHLIQDLGIPPWSILAITFTNKAAAEMRERISVLVGPAARDIWASTFHSACVRILRREAEAAGYRPDFAIYDADDQLRLMRACFADEEVDPKRYAPRAVLGRISDAKNRMVDAEAFMEEASGPGDDVVARLYRRYGARLQAAGAMDFDDLLMVATRLLESDAEVRERYQSRFAYVMVDEYQDTNHAQYRLVRLLAEPQRNICAVGDDDQGIYSWRGADVRNILDFERDYPDAHIVALEQNYRSTGTILRAANAVVARNRGRRKKELWTDLGDGEPLRLLGCRDEHDEARTVLAEIDRARSEGISLDQIAVFYRTNAQSRSIEDQLVRGRIAYAVVGGPRFYERAEVRDALAYLRAAANPADEIAVARLLGVPKRGLGPGSLVKLAMFAAEHGYPIGDALGHADEVPGLTSAQRAALSRTANLLAELAEADAAGLPLSGLVAMAVDRSGLRAALMAEGTLEAQGRVENLDELENVAAEYDSDDGEPTLTGFLEEVALQSDADLVDQSHGQVTLMTVHNAKGLEFDVVLMTGMEEGIFPHARADDPEALEEERRLCYVGMTRARRRLLLTHAETRAIHGGREYRLPSRFLTEIPQDAMAAREGAPMRAAFAGASQRSAAVPLEAGDTVMHATFGEGVVTGIESRGSLVRVLFNRDGTERRLMAGAAPMRKVG
jgi:DNA helicase II / ATP-dependent DNA helicase PcrA